MKTTPRVILILKQASSAARLHKTLTQKLVLTWWHEFKKKFLSIPKWRLKFKKRFPTAPLIFRQENKRRRTPRVSHNFAVRKPLRQLKQTRFCWPFSKGRRTVIQPNSTRISQESQNCLSPSRQQCPPSTGNQWDLNYLKIYSKRV